MELNKKYFIKCDGKVIGHTLFEGSDAPMGVVSGAIYFEGIESGYDFVMSQKESSAVTIYEDLPEDNFVNASFENITVFSETGTEIKSLGINITGFEDDFEISVLGIAYPFYEEEFPHHREAYENQFK